MNARIRTAPILLILLMLLVGVVATGCGGDSTLDGSGEDESSQTESEGGGSDDASLDEKVAERADSYTEPPLTKLDAVTKVKLETEEGDILLTVDPKLAPRAAANFVGLVKDGYYDGTKFHRVIDGFMIQGGDPLGTGTGGPGYALEDDPVKGTYTRGTLAMANAGPNTGGSQFFIVQGDDVQLAPDYVIFGSTDDAGMKVVDKIAQGEVNGDQAVNPVRITKATVVD